MRAVTTKSAARAAVAILVLVGLTGLATPSDAATLKVYSPAVEQGAFEFEAKGWYESNIDGGKEDKQKHLLSAGYGVTNFWFTEGILEFEKEGDGSLKLEAFEWENVFQLTPQGKYWLDLGFLAELEFPKEGDHPEEFIFGPLIQKEIGRTVHTANILFEKQFGTNAADGVALLYAWESRWRVNQYFEPGFEAFGEFGEIGHFNPGREQEHRIGPMFAGRIDVGKKGGYIKYVLGALVGLTHNSPELTLNWRIEYETRF